MLDTVHQEGNIPARSIGPQSLATQPESDCSKAAVLLQWQAASVKAQPSVDTVSLKQDF